MLWSSSLRRVVGLLLLVVVTGCAPDVINCDLHMVAQMPLEVQDNLLVVPAGINGKWVRLVVDTGAERTTLADSSAEQLGLPHDSRYTTRSLGVGGTTTTTDVTIDRLVLGGVHFPLERIAVGTFTLQSDRGLNADGLLGADILLAFDLDIDMPNGRLSLYRPRICPGGRLPWPEPAAEIPGIQARRDRLMVPFELDNVPGMAILDTGAQRDVLGVAMARRLNLTSQDMAGDPTITQHGVGPAQEIVHLHRFSLLRIGPVARESPQLPVMQSEAGMGDALIGQEFMRGRRIWMSFRNRQIYVSVRSSPTRPVPDSSAHASPDNARSGMIRPGMIRPGMISPASVRPALTGPAPAGAARGGAASGGSSSAGSAIPGLAGFVTAGPAPVGSGQAGSAPAGSTQAGSTPFGGPGGGEP